MAHGRLLNFPPVWSRGERKKWQSTREEGEQVIIHAAYRLVWDPYTLDMLVLLDDELRRPVLRPLMLVGRGEMPFSMGVATSLQFLRSNSAALELLSVLLRRRNSAHTSSAGRSL